MSYCFRFLNYAKYFRHVQKIKYCLCLKLLLFSFMESSIITVFYMFTLCLVFKLCKSTLQILQFISGHLMFLVSIDIGGCLIVASFERRILTLSHFSNAFFWPGNLHVKSVYSPIFWAWTMFHLRFFSIDIHKKCKCNHYLLLLVIFLDLRMTQFWSVKYISLVYKLKFLLWTYPKFWATFMRDLLPLYLELFFLVLFEDCGNLFFWQNFFRNLILMFSFYPKNGRTGCRKCYPTPHWVAAFSIFFRLVYDIPFLLNGLILVWSTSLQLCWKVNHRNSRILYQIFPFLKQVVSVIQFSDMLIIIEWLFRNWKER